MEGVLTKGDGHEAVYMKGRAKGQVKKCNPKIIGGIVKYI